MSDVTVHHCTLRIVRHGGWGWGSEPRKLLQSAIKALPELLARALGELWPDDVEREFAAPIQIRVPLSMGELLAISNEGSDPNSLQTSPAIQALSERIGSMARRALVTEQTASVTDFEQVSVKDLESETNPFADITDFEKVSVANLKSKTKPHPGITDFEKLSVKGPESPESETRLFVDQRFYSATKSRTGSAVLDALLSWHKDGVLSRRLAAFSLTALEAWLDRLIRIQSVPPDKESAAQETIERFVDESARLLHSVPCDRAATLRRRLIVLTEVIARLDLRQCPPALLTALERAFPLAQEDEMSAAELNNLREFGDGAEGASPFQAAEHPARATSVEQAIHERGRSGGAKLTGLDGQSVSDGQTAESTSLSHQAAESASLPHAAKQAEPPATFAERARPQPEEPLSMSFSPATTEPALSSPMPPPPSLTETYPTLLRPQREHTSFQFSRQERTRRIASALPFLLLGPLSRVGYLKALAATMEAANALEATPLFAAALAYKVLAPPARGWRREPGSVEAASTFGLLSQPASEQALVKLARNLPEHLSPLDAALSGALISGHKREQPLLLLRTDSNAESGFLLVDVEGTFPIQWAASVAELRQVLIQLDSSIVLIPQAAAEVELLSWMDEEGFRFVTDAIPTRGEHWRSLRRAPHERWWTNETIMSDSALMRTASAMRDAAEEAATLWQALIVERPSIPLADKSGLDRHLAMAASIALGTIAWELWREREPTTPYLALERFCDLEARVSCSRDVVRVSLPLGKRFHDLRHQGLIDDVNDVPWFNGRTLTFTSG